MLRFIPFARGSLASSRPLGTLAVAVLVTSALGASAAFADSFDPSRARMVELTHPFNASTIYWPTVASGFGYMPITSGRTAGGWFYSAGGFQAPEHGGTHMDAPVHFKEGGATVDKVPLSSLFAPVVVIDVSASTIGQRDYELQVGDIIAFETMHGPIPRGAIALMRSGWSKRWDDRKEYLGDDTPGDASNLHFPGIGEEAAHVLIEQRGVAAIGLDTASLDCGKSTDFLTHRVASAAGIPGFENLTNLDQLPPKGAWLMALPMMIEGGTGAPLRAVALVPEGR